LQCCRSFHIYLADGSRTFNAYACSPLIRP
jgi:hypothetical protein